MKVISLFSGAGGLDLGFTKGGFEIAWANDFNQKVEKTYNYNHKNPIIIESITKIDTKDTPDCIGIIGGPPCQSWSVAGSHKGIEDKRGQLFHDYIRFIDEKKPLFFLAENVKGILSKRHVEAKEEILQELSSAGDGYNLSVGLLNAKDFEVPQERERVFFIGFRKDLNIKFDFDEFLKKTKIQIKDKLTKEYGYEKEFLTLFDTIREYQHSALMANEKNKTTNIDNNNEYGIGGFSSQFMSRNRVKAWDEQSFTIQASVRHAPLHPQAPKMEFVERNIRKFSEGNEHLYRRLSVRECATIQTFPKDFKFIYQDLNEAYKMIGNAVPVNLAYYIAKEIKSLLEGVL